jgi:hypothetical protein
VATVIGHALAAIRDEAGALPVFLLLTHPVGWSKPQRAALVEATRLAGARPAGLLSEAEAVGWHVCGRHRPAGPLLVVDLGASTLDIALLDLSRPGKIEVRYADGDNNIGGDDFDAEIIAFVLEELREDPRDAALLDQLEQLCVTLPHIAAREAERIKLDLAVHESATFAHRDIALTLTQDDFLQATQHLVDRIISRVRHAIGRGGGLPRTMVVSGGAAQLPSIQDALAKLASDSGISVLDWEAVGLTGTVTTAVALGATRMPQPWRSANVRAIRPVTLKATRIWPESRKIVAIPDGVVVQRSPRDGYESDELVLERQANPTGTALLTMLAGITQLSYDPFADRLVTASRTKTICTYQLNELNGAFPQRAHGAVFRRGLPQSARSPQQDLGTVTALAARGPLVAWTESEGPGMIIWQDRCRYQPGFSVRWLGFTATPHLLVVGTDRLVLVDPATAAEIAALPLVGPQPVVTALAPDSALVFTASGRELACHHTGKGQFDLEWRRDNYVVPAMAVARLDGRPVLVVFDARGRMYRALDARTGELFAIKDVGRGGPTELLADGNSRIVYARHGNGSLSVLTFAETRP